MERQTQSTISNANQCALCVLKSHFELAANNCVFCRSRQDKHCCALSHVYGILRWSAGSLSLVNGAILLINGKSIKVVARHKSRSEERRVGKECRSRWSPYH